jgi:Ca2+-binding RTX toxin-like protein
MPQADRLPLTYRHDVLTLADLVDQTVAALSGFVVAADGRSSTTFDAGFIGADGQPAFVRISGEGFAFSGNTLTKGRIESLWFENAAGVEIGRLDWLGLSKPRLDTLLQTPDGLASWLMAQNWNTQFFHDFQPVTTLPAGSLLDSGQVFELQGDDVISLGQGADTFDIGRGNDILYGRHGNDTLSGGKGNDTIKGNQGDDAVRGGSGNDDLYAGSGKDRLTGGKGADRFVWEVDYRDTGLSLGGQRDTISDFNPLEDVILLDLSDVGVTGPGQVSFIDHADGTVVRVRYQTGGQALKQDILLVDVDPGSVGFAEIVFT